MAEWLAPLTSDHKVQGSNPAGAGIQLMTVPRFIAHFIDILPSSQYELNNVEMDVKHQGPVVQMMSLVNASLKL